MTTPKRLENWDAGGIYESYVGRWSRLVAAEFVPWLGVSPRGRWLDVGCGTGALSQSILRVAEPAAVTGVDKSAAFVAYARQQVSDDRVTFQVGDAVSLPVERDHYDAAVSGLCLNFVPDHLRMVQEMTQAVRPGGTVAVYVWDYADQMQLMRYFWDAVVALNTGALELDESRRFPICQPEPLAALWRSAGLEQVSTRSIDIPTQFRDFDDYWTPFLGGQGTAPTYVQALDAKARDQLRDYLRERLPTAVDGSISLIARAWAVRGVRIVRKPE
ncbi:MAG: methyltransferase domain-containing protein [Anaerolineae bacterium]|nr:methyltransferase domain-containing protein [Anaerolineae bacterium]